MITNINMRNIKGKRQTVVKTLDRCIKKKRTTRWNTIRPCFNSNFEALIPIYILQDREDEFQKAMKISQFIYGRHLMYLSLKQRKAWVNKNTYINEKKSWRIYMTAIVNMREEKVSTTLTKLSACKHILQLQIPRQAGQTWRISSTGMSAYLTDAIHHQAFNFLSIRNSNLSIW